MLSERDASAICYTEINRPDPAWPDKPEIIITRTEERERSWVFFYQSSLYIETQEFSHSLVGNGPCIVQKKTGRFAFTATFPPIEERIAEAEAWLESQGNEGARSVTAFGPT